MENSETGMICPQCNAAMNHHADKWIERLDRPDDKQPDAIPGGFIEEVHGCPSCGAVKSRRAK